MATARHCFSLVTIVCCYHVTTLNGLQLGPFTLPTLGNGGALGFTNNLLNASLSPSAGRASLGVQAPTIGSSVNTFTALANRFSNLVPGLSNGPRGALGIIGVPSASSLANGFRPSTSDLVQSFLPTNGSSGNPAGTLLNVVNRFRNAAGNMLPNLSALNPTGAILNSFPRMSLLPPLSERTTTRNLIPPVADSGLESFARLTNAADSFQRVISNATRTLSSEDFSGLLMQIPGAQQGIEQFSEAVATVTNPEFWSKLTSNGIIDGMSSTQAAKLSDGINKLATGLSDVMSSLPAIPEVKIEDSDHKNAHFFPGRNVIVHLFEWKFGDIAEECEQVLGPAGYGGVQVSPVNEYVRAPTRPWWERYQPVSYEIRSRSGNESEFAEMVRRCQRAKVRVYVDIVANHMAGAGATTPLYGTAGSPSDPAERLYPAVPFNKSHFHQDCIIESNLNASQVHNCQLGGLPDLNQTDPYVREKIVGLMNRLIEYGVAGFRMDSAKYIAPDDLDSIYKALKPLNPMFQFPLFSAPFIYQDVDDFSDDSGTASQYTDLGLVTDPKYSLYLGSVFHSALPAPTLQALTARNATQYGLIPSESALTFVDSHINQRSVGAISELLLTYKDMPQYLNGVAFTLATDYGTVRLMSSYRFEEDNHGPPADELEQILSPGTAEDGYSCFNGWVCEHRWPVLRRMVAFRNFVHPATIHDIQATNETFAFCRGNIGFAAFNVGTITRDIVVRTCLPAGEYCDLITGEKRDTTCSGTRVLVNEDSTVSLTLPAASSLVLDLRNRVM
ncbi:alpha-amylase-like [Anopheles albimanus]|uniref:Alpha-amylase n=1 Tax=Anopheles albimanus TaxID=7167 RepID=A0A182FHC6_ANOAL|nr:alpha-amylase-like [Anopheles albimanus]